MNRRTCVVACLVLAVSVLYAQPEGKEGDPKEGAGQRDDAAWQKRLGGLGDGPIYQVEVLATDEWGRLYYLRTVISPKIPRDNGMLGTGSTTAWRGGTTACGPG